MKSLIEKLIKTGLITASMVLGLSAMPALVPTVAAQDDLNMSSGADAAKGNDQADELFGDDGLFQTISNILLFLIGAVSVIMLIIGGLRYVLSQGDQNAVTSAKNTILYAVIGIIVALLAFAIVNFVIGGLSAEA